ncbi:ubiquinone biosynthesis protein UbiA [Bacillus sp. J14TS2]|uniref:UbiA family prenyltransferase n=1 Tax=Bacillus sp. J14TS2 TaxID=2807188 RepID=UPI001B244F44|nr:UbiA family prenyltransferase [Bacillus sp. J14TS2]GIN69550.1 ubiquinone biosynthesis protein UbiA [Bacillus sp. J14TS2]
MIVAMNAIWFEIYLSWRVVRSNFVPSVIAGGGFSIAAWSVSSEPALPLPIIILVGAIHGLLTAYSFDAMNQLIGIEEDKVNKPHRPIPSGLCTPKQIERRIPIVLLVHLFLIYIIGGMLWIAIWIIYSVAYNYWGGARQWFIKTLLANVSTLVVTIPLWIFINGDIGPMAITWFTVFFIYWFTCSILQDLRDIKGDKLNGRRTLPMILGDTLSRKTSAIALTFQPLLFIVPIYIWGELSVKSSIGILIFTISSWYLVWRILHLRTKDADDMTYKLYTALSVLLMMGPLFL